MNLQCIVLSDGLTIQDVIRALRYSGIGISNTHDPHIFRADRLPSALPAYDYTIPALLRRQAE